MYCLVTQNSSLQSDASNSWCASVRQLFVICKLLQTHRTMATHAADWRLMSGRRLPSTGYIRR